MSKDNARGGKQRFDLSLRIFGAILQPSVKLVWLYLLQRANNELRCWPSVARIANDCMLSERMVQYAIRRLKAVHEIRVVGKHGDDIRYATQIFELSYRAAGVHPSSPLRDEPRFTPKLSSRGAKTQSRGATSRHPGVNHVAPRTTIRTTNKSLAAQDTADGGASTPKISPQQVMFGAIRDAFGFPGDSLADDDQARIGKAAKRLVAKGATPEDVAIRKRRYEQQHPDWGPCTIEALVKHWHDLATDKTTKAAGAGRISKDQDHFDAIRMTNDEPETIRFPGREAAAG